MRIDAITPSTVIYGVTEDTNIYIYIYIYICNCTVIRRQIDDWITARYDIK